MSYESFSMFAKAAVLLERYAQDVDVGDGLEILRYIADARWPFVEAESYMFRFIGVYF